MFLHIILQYRNDPSWAAAHLFFCSSAIQIEQLRQQRSEVRYGGRSPKFIWAQCHVMCTAVLIGWDPATPPFPPHCDSYTRALLVSKDRRHLFVTPWGRPKAMRRSRDLRLYASSKTHQKSRFCTCLFRQTDRLRQRGNSRQKARGKHSLVQSFN